MACFHIQRLLPEVRARRASHNCSAAIGDGGEKSRSDLRDGVRWAWAKPSLDEITTSSALSGSGSPETFPAPCARPTRARARQKSSKSCAGDAQHHGAGTVDRVEVAPATGASEVYVVGS